MALYATLNVLAFLLNWLQLKFGVLIGKAPKRWSPLIITNLFRVCDCFIRATFLNKLPVLPFYPDVHIQNARSSVLWVIIMMFTLSEYQHFDHAFFLVNRPCILLLFSYQYNYIEIIVPLAVEVRVYNTGRQCLKQLLFNIAHFLDSYMHFTSKESTVWGAHLGAYNFDTWRLKMLEEKH